MNGLIIPALSPFAKTDTARIFAVFPGDSPVRGMTDPFVAGMIYLELLS